jgi:hypothetical protein
LVPPPPEEAVVLVVDVVVVVEEELVVVGVVVLRVVLCVEMVDVVAGGGTVTVWVGVSSPPHPAIARPAASARAATAAIGRLVTRRRARVGEARNRDSR